MSIDFRFDLPPEKAVEFLKSKGYKLSFDWEDMTKEEHDTAFTVAKMTDMDLLKDVHKAVTKALEDGQTNKEFAAGLIPLLQQKGWWGRQEAVDPLTGEIRQVQLGSTRRLETIFRTNLKTAYAAGLWQEIQENKDAFPYLMYDAVKDTRTRDEHKAWDGIVLPVDDPWWKTHFPPNGWNCRCTVEQLTERMLKRVGKTGPDKPPESGSYEWTNPRTGKTETIPAGIDPGWNYTPGQSTLARSLKVFEEKLEKDDAFTSEALKSIMKSEVFKEFFDSAPRGVNFPVLRLNESALEALGTERKVGVMSGDSLAKNKKHHPDLDFEDYLELPELGSNPDLILQVADEKLVVVKKGDDFFLCVIKATKDRSENFVVSFRKTNLDDIESLRKRGKVVWEK